MPSQSPQPSSSDGWSLRIFALVFGGLLGFALLKFPNPSVVEYLVAKPNNIWEWLITAWPVRYGQAMMAAAIVAGVALMRPTLRAPVWAGVVPAAWLSWVALSYTQSIDPELSGALLRHFAICVGCFYVGFLALGRLQTAGFIFAGILAAFLMVLAVGWQQRLGGLAESQQYFFTYIYPTLKEVPPELLKRMRQDEPRIFSTLFYPNSLAGALLLLTPLVLGVIADARVRLTMGSRWLLSGIVGVAALGCIVWSGSKGGWLVALALILTGFLRAPLTRRVKVAVVSMLLLLGVAGFLVRYLVFFQRGATSVVARFDYWRAAVENTKAHPWLGSGPGTFVTVYKQTKPPGAEMARLAHNDYLQQASDSGVMGGLLFLATIGGVLAGTWHVWTRPGWMAFGVWLGLAGFAVQSAVEFGFYVPATGWCWFGLAGWLVGVAGLRFDNRKAPA
jgi:O-antigen ligase